MEVVRVEKVKQAEINKEAELVKAEEEKRKIEIDAEARKNATIKNAEADKEKQFLEAAALLEVKDKESQGIAKIGAAEAEALKLKELAPVTAQITLAKEIGENEGYQHYLVTIKEEFQKDCLFTCTGMEQTYPVAAAASLADIRTSFSLIFHFL